jgi:hypothetical protein
MTKTFCMLLAAHLIADFLVQTDWMAKRKKQMRILLLHGLIVMVAAVLLLGCIPLLLLSILAVSHVAIDAGKAYLFSDRLKVFIVDQLVHIAILLALSYAFAETAGRGKWLSMLSSNWQSVYLTFVTILAGAILCIPAGGVLIGLATAPFLAEINEEREETARTCSDGIRSEGHATFDRSDQSQDVCILEGLRKGGRYIGWLERSLVMLLLLINLPNGIGFLFAAKSILRFGEIKDSHQRKTAEYIIIGTFLSFGWALGVSYLTQQAVKLWQ